MVQRVMASGKAEGAGIFPGKRGGYFVLSVDTAEELMELVVRTGSASVAATGGIVYMIT